MELGNAHPQAMIEWDTRVARENATYLQKLEVVSLAIHPHEVMV